MTLIAHIALAIAALLALLALLRRDIVMLQRNHFSNSSFNAHLRESSDLTSPSRLLAVAVLIGSITTMAQESWAVVAILAATLAAMGIYMLIKKQAEPKPFTGRAIEVFAISIIVAIIATAAAAIYGMSKSQVESAHSASLMMLMCAIASPLLAMLSNWLLGLFKKNEETGTNGEQ